MSIYLLQPGGFSVHSQQAQALLEVLRQAQLEPRKERTKNGTRITHS
jgi:hypothetical protein